MIVAGPGTGKTHTLSCRIAQFCEDLPAGQKILAITFTNRAAEEMRRRLEARIPDIEQKVFVGTFHQFCLLILREHGVPRGFVPQDFRVASPEDIENTAKTLWGDKKARERKLLLEEISRFKATRYFEDPPEPVVALTRTLRRQGLLDFDDLLVETVQLLKKAPDILQELQVRYQRIFVDEYQDINPVQHGLLKFLASAKSEITAIGDPNQAIYGFRGADVKFFNTFSEDFSGATILALAENYRSAKTILSASAQVAAGNEKFVVPELIARIYSAGRRVIHEASTDRAEAEYVVHQIEKMVGGTSMFSRDSGRVAATEEGAVSFGDIAVLYRLNSQSRVLREAFERSGIPFHVCGEEVKEEDSDVALDVYRAANREPDLQAEKIALMTMHSAKGLEFSVVFIVGCEQNLLPLDLEGLTSDKEEERRLFYVGMTRAKERLYLVRAKRRLLYGKMYHPTPSPFLTDIEEGLKEYEKTTSRRRRKKKTEQQTTLF